jgi:hypothetical protein
VTKCGAGVAAARAITLNSSTDEHLSLTPNPIPLEHIFDPHHTKKNFGAALLIALSAGAAILKTAANANSLP